jgi:hypothetical protein
MPRSAVVKLVDFAAQADRVASFVVATFEFLDRSAQTMSKSPRGRGHPR